MRHPLTPLARMEVQLHTFLFADISRYSALAELAGDEAAAEMAISFADTVSRLAAEHNAEVVRRIGDGVMVHGTDPGEVIELGLKLQARFGTAIHTGIHTGPALRRDHDWWGCSVNVASRVAGAAAAGQLLVSEAAASAADDARSCRLHATGALRLKNISAPVRVYAPGPAPAARWSALAAAADVGLRAARLVQNLLDVGLRRQRLGADAA